LSQCNIYRTFHLGHFSCLTGVHGSCFNLGMEENDSFRIWTQIQAARDYIVFWGVVLLAVISYPY